MPAASRFKNKQNLLFEQKTFNNQITKLTYLPNNRKRFRLTLKALSETIL